MKKASQVNKVGFARLDWKKLGAGKRVWMYSFELERIGYGQTRSEMLVQNAKIRCGQTRLEMLVWHGKDWMRENEVGNARLG